MSAVAAAEQRWNEAALAAPVATPAWRLWPYEQAAVVLGRSQRSLFAEACHASSLQVLTRSAGGGAVLVGPWLLGVSAALPARHPLALDAVVRSYRWLGEGIARSLQHVGVHDAIALSPEAARVLPCHAGLDWACFGGLSAWEVVVGARKIAGLAQVRRRSGVLLVAGVLLHPPPWQLLCRALGRPDAMAERLSQLTTCCAAQGVTAVAQLAPALARMLARALSPTAAAAAAG